MPSLPVTVMLWHELSKQPSSHLRPPPGTSFAPTCLPAWSPISWYRDANCYGNRWIFRHNIIPTTPHRGQPPCRGGGAQHRWPERFLKSGGEEQLLLPHSRLVIAKFIFSSTPIVVLCYQWHSLMYTVILLWYVSGCRALSLNEMNKYKQALTKFV